MIARKKPRKQSDVNSDDEHRKCVKIVTFEGTIDSEIMKKKSFIARLNKIGNFHLVENCMQALLSLHTRFENVGQSSYVSLKEENPLFQGFIAKNALIWDWKIEREKVLITLSRLQRSVQFGTHNILRFGHLHDVFIELEDVLGYHRFDSSFNLINNDEKEKDKRVRGLVVLNRLLNLQARGPSYPVELGRLDGLSSTTASVGGKLPKPNQNLDQLNAMFSANGLTQADMIALS
ncbi:peroxidase 1, partial [Tanacetum coccineum]